MINSTSHAFPRAFSAETYSGLWAWGRLSCRLQVPRPRRSCIMKRTGNNFPLSTFTFVFRFWGKPGVSGTRFPGKERSALSRNRNAIKCTGEVAANFAVSDGLFCIVMMRYWFEIRKVLWNVQVFSRRGGFMSGIFEIFLALKLISSQSITSRWRLSGRPTRVSRKYRRWL